MLRLFACPPKRIHFNAFAAAKTTTGRSWYFSAHSHSYARTHPFSMYTTIANAQQHITLASLSGARIKCTYFCSDLITFGVRIDARIYSIISVKTSHSEKSQWIPSEAIMIIIINKSHRVCQWNGIMWGGKHLHSLCGHESAQFNSISDFNLCRS